MARQRDEFRVRERLRSLFDRPATPASGAAAAVSRPDRPVGAPGPIPPSAAFDPGRRGLRALIVVAVVVLATAAMLAWRARPRVEQLAPEAGPVASPQIVPPSAPAILVVAVTGRVHRPGLVRVPTGSRVADAVEAAGGVLPGTDLTQVNLARRVADGELIAIGVPQPPGAGPGAPAGGGPGDAGPSAKVNLNTATIAELDALPGVGPVLAQRIVDHRLRHGGFRAVTDLRQVDGIGDERFEQLKDLVIV